MIGSTVSHYRILERLGGGGMGVVYKAVDLRLDRPVALKFLAGLRGAGIDERRRFLREARAASALDHPNIATIYEIGDTGDGALFLAMALCEGETLRDRIDRGPLPISGAVEIAMQVAAGLARAHERGIVHRDVKPSNVILTAGGTVKLVDFGIAQLAGESRLTLDGTAMGTAAYMSPEQFEGGTVDLRTDVWSLGVVIHEMVTGRPPFGFDATDAVRDILERRPPPLASLRPGVPPALERIVATALAKRPAERYASVETMRSDLQELAATLGVTPPPEPEDRTVLELRGPLAPFRTAPVELGDGLVGRTVGPYEVLDLLGAGGMGVVYKARDARLGRTAALKFLPAELTRDPAAKERFVQEARAASSLDHPNLCTILELGEGPDGRLYLAMPCYDGETLRRRIERGPLPVAEAVEIAEQMARGLAKAHRNGIVHRDVKPANVMLTADGVVKILDFGLAKLAGAAGLSRTGSSAGTPAYMSPEQARGDEVDPRTDLWSLGVVLYEMLAGRRPFRGEREQAVIYSILNETPEPLAALRPDLPPELARLVERLLAKDPAERCDRFDEPLDELRALKGGTATGGTRPLRPRQSRQPRHGGARFWTLTSAGAILAVAALVAAGFRFLPHGGPEAAAAPVQATFTRLTDQEGSETFPSLSPDGRTFLYARPTKPDNLDVYSQRVGGSNAVNLTADSPADDTQPAFSPDGSAVAFRSERDGGGIFLMGATGESVRRLTDFGYNPAWSPDGRFLAVASEGVFDPQSRKSRSQLWRVDVVTGARARLSPGDAVQPSWSPHGLRIAYWGLPTGSAERVISTIPAGGGTPVAVIRDEFFNWSPAWSPDGHYLYFASNRGGSMNLWRVAIDEASGRTLGAPEPITAPSEWSGMVSLSHDGRRIVYSTSENRANLERFALGSLPGGSPHPVTQGSRGVLSCDVSPDGRSLAFFTGSPQEDLFVVGTDGAGLRQLTDDPFRDRHPRWSPDGSRLVFQSDRSGRYELWSLRRDGSGLEPVTRTLGSPLAYPVWAPDGRRLALAVATRGSALLDLSLPLEQRKPVLLPPVSADGEIFYAVSWSSDGRWLAGVTESRDARSLPGVVLYSLAAKSYTRLTTRGDVPRWLPDGSLLVLEKGAVHAVDRRTGALREVVSPPSGSSFLTYCTSRDGRDLFVSRLGEEGDVCMLTLR